MWRIRDIYPGSRIRLFSIPDPNCLHPGSSSKNLSILTPKKAKKWFLSSKKYDPGCSSRILMLTFSHPGSRGQKGTQSRIPDPDPQHWKQENVAGALCAITWWLNIRYFHVWKRRRAEDVALLLAVPLVGGAHRQAVRATHTCYTREYWIICRGKRSPSPPPPPLPSALSRMLLFVLLFPWLLLFTARLCGQHTPVIPESIE